MNTVLQVGAATLAAITAALNPLAASAARERVVVELFQSQGCSSCPPANANVNALASRDDVLALSFAITYWDKLGWRDTFARDEFTNRQYDYSRGLHTANVYTPQVVLNGRQDLTGIDRGELDRSVAKAGRLSAGPLFFDGMGLGLRAGPAPRTAADIWLVRYDPRVLEVPVQSGENGGRTLPHKNIVREFTRLGTWNGQAQKLNLPPPTTRYSTAILLQESGGGPILAVLVP